MSELERRGGDEGTAYYPRELAQQVVSRPGNCTPAPLRTVRETLASHGSHQTNQPFNVNGWSLILRDVILFPVVSNL